MRWWVSFADDTGNLGWLIADKANTTEEVVQQCNLRKCNPGGEILVIPIDEQIASKNQASYAWLNSVKRYTLYQKKDVPEFTGLTSVVDAKKQGWMPKSAQYVCEDCNCAECVERRRNERRK